jgi:hypothetical protein
MRFLIHLNIIPFIATLPVSILNLSHHYWPGLLVNLFHLVLFTFDCIYGALTYNDDSVPAKIATLVESLSVCLVNDEYQHLMRSKDSCLIHLSFHNFLPKSIFNFISLFAGLLESSPI